MTTIALLLGILLMAATLYVGAEIAYRYIQLQNALQDIGATFDPGAAEGDPLQEVPDTGQDLGPFATTPLDVPTPDGTVCSEDGTRNVIVCEGPSADDGELYYNGAVID